MTRLSVPAARAHLLSVMARVVAAVSADAYAIPKLRRLPARKQRPRSPKARGHSRTRSCGGTLRVVAYLSDPIAIRRVLEELGLSPPQKAAIGAGLVLELRR